MEPTTPDIWTVLWPVIIGGLLAVLPSVVGQVVVHLFAQASAKEARSRQQFLKLAEGIASYEAWMTRRHNAKAFGEADPGESPLPSILAIASLDFPVLLDAIDAVTASSHQYELWQNQAAIKRLQGKMSEVNEGINEAYTPFLRALSTLKDDLRILGVSLHSS